MTKLLHAIKTSKTRNKGGLFPLYTSVFGVFLCIGCLAGVTWAWFAASMTTDTNTFVSANSSIGSLTIEERVWETTTQIEDESGNVIKAGGRDSWWDTVAETNDDYQFEAEGQTLYRISYTMNGTAKTQLIMVETKDGNYYSDVKDSEVELLLENSGKVKIYASWGEDTGDAEEITKEKAKKIARIGNGAEDIPDIPVVVQESEDDDEDTASSSGSTSGGGETSTSSESSDGGEASASGSSSSGGETSTSSESSGRGEASGSGASGGGETSTSGSPSEGSSSGSGTSGGDTSGGSSGDSGGGSSDGGGSAAAE